MNILVIGGVAAGTKTAAKIKRNDFSQNVKVVTKDEHISYAGCGLPYYVGGIIEDKEDVVVNTPENFEALTGVEVETGVEVTEVIPGEKKVLAKDLESGEEKEYTYDKLVIAVGASPIKPPVEGSDLDGIFTMRTPNDAYGLRDYIEENDCKRAVVVGGGFIGLEIAENLLEQGIAVFVVDMADQLLPGYEPDFADYAERYLNDQGIFTFTETALEGFEGEDGKVTKVKTSRNDMKADVVCLSIGVRTNTKFLEGSGIEMNQKGAILVNSKMETNVENIYAVGDCIMVKNEITGQPAYSPMGSTANIEGRIAAENILGGDREYRGSMGTAVVKLIDVNMGKTGLTEAAAKDAGFDPISVTVVADDKAHYFPGAGNFIIKLVADKNTRKILGVTVAGSGTIDKIVDMVVVALACDATLDDLRDADFAYAPPFSTAIHPLAHTINVMYNKLEGEMDSFTPAQYMEGEAEGYKVVDAALLSKIDGAPYVALEETHDIPEVVEKDENLLLVCDKGKRGYMLQQRLEDMGYENTKVLEGGLIFNEVEGYED